MNGLAGTRSLVTGALGGIGAAVCTRLKAAGAIALGTDLSGLRPCDLTDRRAVEAMLDDAGPHRAGALRSPMRRCRAMPRP